MDEMNQVVTCKYCGRKEIYGRMMWLNGRVSAGHVTRHIMRNCIRNTMNGMI